MPAAWESPVLGHVSTEPRVLAEDVVEALELCRSWTEDRVGAR